jgi:hypothetical protein
MWIYPKELLWSTDTTCRRRKKRRDLKIVRKVKKI